jgi:hypothetical protein
MMHLIQVTVFVVIVVKYGDDSRNVTLGLICGGLICLACALICVLAPEEYLESVIRIAFYILCVYVITDTPSAHIWVPVWLIMFLGIVAASWYLSKKDGKEGGGLL